MRKAGFNPEKNKYAKSMDLAEKDPNRVMSRKPPEIIQAINRLIRPLNPPVMNFEASIRATPFRILISVLLSSRTKDSTTQAASEKLFQQAGTPRAMLALGERKIARLIYPVGFYRQKAKRIMAIARQLPPNGEVPQTLDELVHFPGVGRKTANLVLALAFNQPAIAVDIHVFRISRRLGWSAGRTPAEVESDLRELFPAGDWNRINQILVGFGQTLCKPRRPLCQRCSITDSCEYFRQNFPSAPTN